MALTTLAIAKWQLAVRAQPGILALSANCDCCSKTSSGNIGPSTVFQVKMNTCPIKRVLQGWRLHCSLTLHVPTWYKLPIVYLCCAATGVHTVFDPVSCLVQVRLDSASLWKDALTSGAVAALSAAILTSAQLYSANAALWWFDSAVALLVAVILSGLGVASLYMTPWWTSAFWHMQESASHVVGAKLPDLTCNL